jgi:hypothetical protein
VEYPGWIRTWNPERLEFILPASLDLHQPAKDTGYDTFSPCAPSFGVDDRLVVEGISTWRSAA